MFFLTVYELFSLKYINLTVNKEISEFFKITHYKKILNFRIKI